MACSIGALIWKHLLLRRNHWMQTLLEICVPVAMMLLINLYFPPLNFGRQESFEVNLRSHMGEVVTDHKYRVIYAPSNAFTDNLMSRVALLGGMKKSNVKPGSVTGNAPYDYGINFSNLTNYEENEGMVLNYTIYPSAYTWPKSFPLWQSGPATLPTFVNEYQLLSFTELEHYIGLAFESEGSDEPQKNITFKEMDHLASDVSLYNTFVVFAIFFAYTFLVPPTITRIVEEKTSGAKELMLMMGVHSLELWVAKLIDAMLVAGTVMSITVMLLYVPLSSESTVLHIVSPLTFWCVLMAGMLAVVLFLFFLSCLFDSATFAALCAIVIGAISGMVVGFVQVLEVARWRRLLYCLLPHMCLVYGTQILLSFEYYEKDVKWFEQLSQSDTALTLSDVFMMIIVDITIYGILTAYVDKIRPGKFGVPQPYGFFLKKSYWLDNRISNVEKEPIDGRASSSGISVRNLTKEFCVRGRPNFVAVNNVSMEVPAGEITALLGHNGAGKSTTMSIITGLIPATSGTVFINGHNIHENPVMARKSLGLCPQQDLLFPDLTSSQVLTFFGMIKGMSRAAASHEANELLKFLKMEKAVNTYTQDLSGGMKRKVSLGIALIGDSSVVILDEPTSGVDPELRREICDLLLTFRGKRTILLTTHIMEEADAVSDRIVILDHGKVQCCGTPMALKAQFGTGYTLSMVTPETGDDKALMEKIKRNVSGARARPRNATTLTVQLPQAESLKFPALFETLDVLKTSGDIHSYSVSVSTLEDVFIRVRDIEKLESRGGNVDEDEVDGEYERISSNCRLNESKHTGGSLFFCQLAALLTKKWIEFRRLWIEFSLFVGIPLAIILLNLFIAPSLSTYFSPVAEQLPSTVNFSAPLYAGTEILLAYEHNCSTCGALAESFREIAEATGFHVTASAQNLTFDVESLFLQDYHQYSRYLLLAVNFTSSNVEVIHNTLAVHAVPVAVDLIHNAALTAINGGGRIMSNLNLNYVKERPGLSDFKISLDSKDSNLQDVSGIQTLFYMSALLLETKFGAKALQLMTVSPALFWFSHLLFDLLSFLPYVFVVIGAYGLGSSDDIIFEHVGDLFIAVILWGTGLIQISYLITCITRNRANALIVSIFVYMFFSFFVWPAIGIELLSECFTYVHPTLIWKMGLSKYGTPEESWYLLHLLIYSISMFVLLCLLDSRRAGRIAHGLLSSMCRVNYAPIIESDSDVECERVAVDECWATDNKSLGTLLVKNVRRFYGVFRPRAAVRGVSFRAMPGECFGLLGVNGAGKSTTFNVLTAQIAASDGDAKINSKRLAACQTEPYLSGMSYCPQSSGIIPILEGREFLELFTRLRGYKGVTVRETVSSWISSLDLEDSADRQCGGYSGGTERKLSAAVAFLYDAAIVMLDEPTSGVDPVARRCIWKAISTTQKAGKAIVLTSHSMDECEALCSRLAIMVSGSFRCIGETATLKNKFGAGYSVQVKLGAGSQDEIDKFKESILDTLGPDCRLTDQHCSILHYHVSDKTTNWKTLFQRLEDLKATYPIFQSYMASETTLEEIFLSFAGKGRGLGNVQCIDISSE